MDKEKQIEEMAEIITEADPYIICKGQSCLTCEFTEISKNCYIAKAICNAGYRKQENVAEDVLEKVKEKIDPTISALFIIGEILVDESKSHISAEKALDNIRKELGKSISSRYRMEKMLEEIKEECCNEVD